jgi:hypothetical protein
MERYSKPQYLHSSENVTKSEKSNVRKKLLAGRNDWQRMWLWKARKEEKGEGNARGC